MSASKNRPRWNEMPALVQRQIEELVGGRVVAAENCDSGFPPRFAPTLPLAEDRPALPRLPAVSAWAARHLDQLIMLECRGLVAARGATLVHFDALPHNILRTDDRVVLVDWPHARLGAPFIDLLMVLASAA